MGKNPGYFFTDCYPVRTIQIDSFFMSNYLVTQKLLRDKDLDVFPKSDEQYIPATMVSWFEAVIFCNDLSIQHNLKPCYTINGMDIKCNFHNNGFRLPTEAEWEYAAKGGQLSLHFQFAGSNSANDVTWYNNNSRGILHSVGQKYPNELGIYDMSGSVWEWCWDWYGKYNPEQSCNPHGPETGETKVYRGGSFLDFSYGCTVFARGHRKPDLKQSDIGFRLVRSSL